MVKLNENKVILEGQVQDNLKIENNKITFSLKANTNFIQYPRNTRVIHTIIKICKQGKVTQEQLKLLQPYNTIKVVGKLDSEHYKSRSGKTVYNKIILADEIFGV